MRLIHVLLVGAILIGVGARFIQLDAHYLNGDEEFYIIAAEKFHAGSDYDVRMWNYHAPPVAKYLMSIPLIGSTVDYSIPYALPANLWVWNYVAYESIGQIYPLVRGMSAVFGVLFIVLMFLIGRELFGAAAGLWAAASAAIAIDYIMLSRLVLVDIFLYTFIASTIYFYIKYRKAQRPFPYMIALLVSLVLMFGSKNAQWLIVIPPLLYVEIVGNRKNVMKTVHFLVIVGVAWFIHSSFIYPPEFSQPAYDFFRQGANANIIEPHLDVFARSMASGNSYLYTALLAATAGLYLNSLGLLKRRLSLTKVKHHLMNPTPYSFLLFTAAMGLVMFSLTSLSVNSKYVGETAIPLFVLGGAAAERLLVHRTARIVLAALLIAGAASVVLYFPTYEGYPGQQVIRFSSPHLQTQPVLDYLETKGNPPIVTNSMNLLLFYKGAAAIPVRDSPACTPEFLEQLKTGGYLGVFRNVGKTERQFLCGQVFAYSGEFQQSDSIRIVSYS